MIYFVDEDVQYARELCVPLQMRGYETKIIENADLAYEELERAEDVQLAIIDIMLATNGAETSRFSAADTDDFLETGLLLMRYLSAARDNLFPNRFVVLTAAGAVLIQKISLECNEMGVEVLKKGDFRDPSTLADSIEEILKHGNI